MTYINTDESEKYDIKHGTLSESPVPGSTARYICNPIIDNIEADPEPNGQRRKRVNGRIVIDTAVPDGDGVRYESPSRLVVGEPSVNNLATHRWHNDGLSKDKAEAAKIEAELVRRIQEGANFIGPRKPPPFAGLMFSGPASKDERAFRQLLEAFHRTVVGPAGDYIPGGGWFSRRQPKEQRHTNDLFPEMGWRVIPRTEKPGALPEKKQKPRYGRAYHPGTNGCTSCRQNQTRNARKWYGRVYHILQQHWYGRVYHN